MLQGGLGRSLGQLTRAALGISHHDIQTACICTLHPAQERWRRFATLQAATPANLAAQAAARSSNREDAPVPDQLAPDPGPGEPWQSYFGWKECQDSLNVRLSHVRPTTADWSSRCVQRARKDRQHARRAQFQIEKLCRKPPCPSLGPASAGDDSQAAERSAPCDQLVLLYSAGSHSRRQYRV